MPIITLRGAIVAGVLSRQVAGKNILFFPSNSVRLLMGSSNEDEKISADDIVGLLTHFSVSRAIKDYVAEGMLYHYPQLVIKKRKVNQIIIHMFKSSIVAPLGSHSIMSSKGRTWRPLNALRTSKCCWDSLMGPSCLVSSSAQDKFVLDCANSFMDCELLSREDFGLVALSAIVPVVGPSRRSLGQATTPTTFFSPDRRDTLSVEVTPIQDRQSRLPPMPSVFLAEDLAMPIAAIIELVCSIGDDGGSDMDIDELGLTLRREVDMAFFGISPKNPLNQKTVTTADLGALARRLDSRHNRAGAFEKRDLLASVDASRLKAVTLLKEACVALGTSTSFAPPVDMRLFEYYRVSEPFRARLDPATTSSRATAPFDFKAERFPAKKQGFAVQKNLDHKAAAILRTADGYFTRVLADDSKKEMLVAWIVELKLLASEERINELVQLAKITVTLTEADEATMEFQFNFHKLDDWMFFSIDSLPVCNLICELSFSQIKQFRNANETQKTTDMKMRYHQNMVHDLREARKRIGLSEEQLMAIKEGKKFAQPNDTKEKVIYATKQLDALSSQRYDDNGMKDVGTVNANRYERHRGLCSKKVCRESQEVRVDESSDD